RHISIGQVPLRQPGAHGVEPVGMVASFIEIGKAEPRPEPLAAREPISRLVNIGEVIFRGYLGEASMPMAVIGDHVPGSDIAPDAFIAAGKTIEISGGDEKSSLLYATLFEGSNQALSPILERVERARRARHVVECERDTLDIIGGRGS